MTFREAYRKDLVWRIFDFVGHCTLAWLVPGVWWWQFLPDCVVPALWARSMVLNRPVPEDSVLLLFNRVLHYWMTPVVLLFCIPFSYLVTPHNYRWLPLHWAAHLVLDQITHRRWKRDLRIVQRGN